MSCGEAERLFVSGSSAEQLRSHAESCTACRAALRDHEEVGQIAANLTVPAWTGSLRRTLLAIPSQTVSCEQADAILASSLEGEAALSAGDRSRWEFHQSRCAACREASRTLAEIASLATPPTAPWLTRRIAASAPAPSRKKRSGLGWLLDPRAAIGLAYAAAIAVMFLGFNPADLTRRARTDIPQEAKSVVSEAKTTLADRIGALEEKAARAVLVTRSRIFGYGRAALSNAVTLVLKSESAPSRSRPRNGEEKSAAPKNNETSMITWPA